MKGERTGCTRLNIPSSSRARVTSLTLSCDTLSLSSFNILHGKGSEAYERFKAEGLTVMNQEAWLITKR